MMSCCQVRLHLEGQGDVVSRLIEGIPGVIM